MSHLQQRPMWGPLHSVSHQHFSASTSHHTDGFLSKGLGTHGWGGSAPYERLAQLSLVPFFSNAWPFSGERQVITENDLLCVGVWWLWRKPVSDWWAFPLGRKCFGLWMQKDLVAELRAFSTWGNSHPARPSSVWLLPSVLSFPERMHSPLLHCHMAEIIEYSSWAWVSWLSNDVWCLTLIGRTKQRF